MMGLDVLVAHDNSGMREAILESLRGHAPHIAAVATGEQALSLLLRRHPRVLVVDVALPGRAPFELCDDIQRSGLRTRVLLVASVYDHTRYKRRPRSLYGADDYVEQHHIHDMLPHKVAQLLGSRPPGEPAPLRAADPETAERIRQAGDEMLSIQYETRDEGSRRAQRLAALLVADVTLYNGHLLASLEDHRDLPDPLGSDLDEARDIFHRLVPEEIRGQRDWIGERFVDLLARRPAGIRAGQGGKHG